MNILLTSDPEYTFKFLLMSRPPVNKSKQEKIENNIKVSITILNTVMIWRQKCPPNSRGETSPNS